MPGIERSRSLPCSTPFQLASNRGKRASSAANRRIAAGRPLKDAPDGGEWFGRRFLVSDLVGQAEKDDDARSEEMEIDFDQLIKMCVGRGAHLPRCCGQIAAPGRRNPGA